MSPVFRFGTSAEQHEDAYLGAPLSWRSALQSCLRVCALILRPSPLLLLRAAALGGTPGRVQGPARRRLFCTMALVRFDRASLGARISPTLPARKGPHPLAGLEVPAKTGMTQQPDSQTW
ncbi:hypothetical protein NDU88_004664 [Pleurodeles waltl]|uniref:Uncharacterized protein n=1 Tax=Pleurodeles waltl TaxID=8319 RepID=A0AAV7TT76_PLEWA|nr:hypothetical protein NDU88_004664 [Pleurodeles waltl]